MVARLVKAPLGLLILTDVQLALGKPMAPTLSDLLLVQPPGGREDYKVLHEDLDQEIPSPWQPDCTR